MRFLRLCIAVVSLVAGAGYACLAEEASDGTGVAPVPHAGVSPLPGTKPLTLSGDIASELVEGVDRFLLREIDKSVRRRAQHWNRDFSSVAEYDKSIEPNRARLAHILGVRQQARRDMEFELVSTLSQPALVGRGHGFQVLAARWPAFEDVYGDGLLLVPKDREPVAEIVAIPDADQPPEAIVGLIEGVPPESQFARRLAESGCRVLVPMLINRKIEGHYRARLTNREFLYRPAYELGRHLIGYEVDKVAAGINCLLQAGGREPTVGVIGYGEGGMLALYVGALAPASSDVRFPAVCVSGYFGPRENVWQEPIDRNVFGLLEQFGDAELASMIAPRTLIVEAARGPEVEIPPGLGGAPGRLTTPRLEGVRREVERARKLVDGFKPPVQIKLVESGDGTGPFGTADALQAFLDAVAPATKLAPLGQPPEHFRKGFPPGNRHDAQIGEILRHNQWLLSESPYVRKEFFAKLDADSLRNIPQTEKRLEEYNKRIACYREFFYENVIGRFDYELLPPNVRSRKAYDEPKWTGYEVVMDVFPDVIAYGILLVPKDIKPGQKRPVVVCQHGLEGRPQEAISGDHRAYHDFAAKLAERGFVTFAPQNPYIFRDRFRTLQRKANPLGKTLFSIIVPQHQQIVDWLKTLPYVDPERIAFYGLSYGGKTAMRVPPLVTDYCLSVCSAAFNDWIWKNAATNTRGRYSYVWTGEYEMFDFDLGSTFNHAEMAALIAPRPFMVERGHLDGVAPDETVAYEFAKVRHLYAAKLGIGDRCQLEWFVGRHEIHGVGTFAFLQKQLNWPKPE